MADYAYARVSTADQDLTIQLDALEQAGVPPSNIFQEKISGVAKTLPVRDQVLALLAPGDRLNVFKVDRVGRSVVEVLGIVRDLDQRKVAFRSVTQSIDTSGSMGRAFLQLLVVFSEMELSLIAERTAAGKARRAAEGLHPGGTALYGFAADHVTIVEHEAMLLRYLADYLLAGAPMNQLVDVLNWRGYRNRGGTRWQVKNVRRILGNPYVVPILGQDRYDRLARIFNRPGRQSLGRPAVALLSGILSCHQCGHGLYLARIQQKNKARRSVYACKKAGQGGRWIGCGSVTVSMNRADAWAEEMFVAAVTGPDFTRSLNQRQAELLATDVTVAELDDWREEIQELEQVQGTRFAPPDAKERHAELRRLVEQATARLMAAPELAQLQDLPKSEAALRERWSRWSVIERRTWLKRLVHTVVVGPATTRSRASVVEDRLTPVWIV
jgi:DNA invertase Pin-like site-specific DNA recombinase